MKCRSSRKKASALILVLWAVSLMSLAVLGVVEFADLGFQESATRAKDFRALQLAESGVALGVHPQVRKTDSILQQDLGSGESLAVKLKSEGARLNINYILANKQQQELFDLFQLWGVSSDDATHAVECLQDWVDADSEKRLNGAEQPDYAAIGHPDYPPNRPFQSVDEMELVIGMDAVIKAKPDWKDSFTVWSDGKLDLNEASAELIQVVCNVGSEQAENLVKRRLGSDGLPDTDDDYTFTSMGDVRSTLGVPESVFKNVENRVTLHSNYRRIESTGSLGTYSKTLVVVVRLNSNPIRYLAWIEL